MLLAVTLEGPLTQEGSREPPQNFFHTLKFLKKIKHFKSQRPFEPQQDPLEGSQELLESTDGCCSHVFK